MKQLAVCLLLAVATSLHAQQPQDDGRNRLIFPPGAKEPLAPSATPTPAQAAPSGDKPAQIIDQFFLTLKANQVEAAYDALVKNTIIADRKEDVTALKAKTQQALESYGPLSGYEMVEELAVGTVLFRRTCLSHNTDLPLRWRFYFYKSEGVWRLVDLRVDDGLVELFDDASRARR